MYDHTHLNVYRLLVTKGASPDDADELVQVTFAKAWERRRQFNQGTFAVASVQGWLIVIALNAWRDQLRRRSPTGDGTGTRLRVFEQAVADLSHAHALAYLGVPDPHDAEGGLLAAERHAERRALAIRVVRRALERMAPSARATVPYLFAPHLHPSPVGVADGSAVQRVRRGLGLTHSAARSALFRCRLALQQARAVEEEDERETGAA